MDQEKIGKFIAICRKNKKLTQKDLAEALGVTEKSISNWENGRNMPDLSLFKPLCDILDITINDLLSGEKISEVDYQNKFEENIVNTIDYSSKRFHKYNQIIAIIIMIFGLFISLSAIMIFPSASSWGSIYSTFGVIIFMLGIIKITNHFKSSIRLLFNILIFIIAMGILLFTDFINVSINEEAPRFRIATITIGDVRYYDTLFYDAYICNIDTENEYLKVIPNQKYDEKILMNYCH